MYVILSVLQIECLKCLNIDWLVKTSSVQTFQSIILIYKGVILFIIIGNVHQSYTLCYPLRSLFFFKFQLLLYCCQRSGRLIDIYIPNNVTELPLL